MSDFISYVLQRLKDDTSIEQPLKQFFLSRKPGIVYGAGDQCRLVLDFSQFFHKPIACLMVSPSGVRSIAYYTHIPMHHIDCLPDAVDRTADVVVALHRRHTPDVLRMLEQNGFSSVFAVEDWNTANENVRKLWYRCFFDYHNVVRHEDKGGYEYRQIDFNGGSYRFYYPENDPVLQSNITGELNDIVLPSLFADNSYLCEGPYEYEAVRLEANDVVIDAGANVGLFSGVAAAKGCRVFAFEPTPVTLGFLQKNLSFYNNVTICPYALCDTEGTVSFNVNTNFEADKSLGSNSMLRRNPAFDVIDVESISLDTFVERSGIDRIDFIKADIEGAERLMLRGAQKTLARFSPRLALCTYHLADDPQVMEQLILQANPRYKIVHKWSKLYAWCP